MTATTPKEFFSSDRWKTAKWEFYQFTVAPKTRSEYARPRKVRVLCPIPAAAILGTGAQRDQICTRDKVSEADAWVQLHSIRKGASAGDMANFYSSVSKNMASGVSVVPALNRSLLNIKSPYLRGVIACLIYFTQDGGTISQAMSFFPQVFNETAVALVEGGERSDSVREVLTGMAAVAIERQKLTQKALGVVLYPLIIFVALSGLICMLQFFLLPRLIPVFTQMLPTGLPNSTKIVFACSNFLRHQWWVFIPIIALVALIIVKRRRIGADPRFQKYIVRIPVVGRVVRLFILIRSLRALAQMLKVTVPADSCYTITGRVAANMVYTGYFEAVLARIKGGIDPDVAFFENRERIGDDGLDIAQAMTTASENGKPWITLNELVDVLNAEVTSRLEVLPMFVNLVTLLSAAPFLVLIALSIVEPSLKMGEESTQAAEAHASSAPTSVDSAAGN